MIDNNEKLAAFLPVVRSAPWLAIDTEADSLHAYPEKVCLIQISTPACDELIDPLAEINLAPLRRKFRLLELIFMPRITTCAFCAAPPLIHPLGHF